MSDRHVAVRCAQCNKVMKNFDPEIIFYKPGDRPFGLHKKCEKAYNFPPVEQAEDFNPGNSQEE